MQEVFVVSGIFWALILSGCATTVKLNEAEGSNLKKISVSKEVEFEERPMFTSLPRMRGAAIAGVVGYAAVVALTSGNDDANPDVLIGYMNGQNISIPEIVREEFIKQVSQAPAFRNKIVPMGGEAQFRLNVGWAMMQEATGKNLYKAGLFVRAELVKGKDVLWRNTYFESPLDQTQGYNWLELFGSPEKLRGLYLDVARKAVTKVLADL